MLGIQLPTPPPEPELEVLDVWPENWETWLAWQSQQNPWRYISGQAGTAIVGLDGAEVKASLELQGYSKKERKTIYAGFRIIADTVIPILNQR